ncbi:YceI family protein [Puia dinghuensis]|uniref:Polyisoprenoid-binding protein n=1 Tax=Puia dinghuensis TaxID=1792502 RepID=A0A8J2XT50_9BACT|nr:YceI family protein [Puia dinghuensis]GGA96127.1 polyisoprenoid-binding protein [Puia dinghuensis]
MATKTKWTIDPGHSKLQFKVKHLAIANVVGTFRAFSGNVESDDAAFENADVFFEGDAASIDTNNNERDNHLKSNLFLDVVQHPKIIFEGKATKVGDDRQVTGNLSIHGVTKPVTLLLEHTGTGEGRFGDKRAGFELSGKINRRDFGLEFDLLAGGNLVVGEEIRIQGDIELVQSGA